MNFAFAIVKKILHCYFLLLVHDFSQKKEAEIGRRYRDSRKVQDICYMSKLKEVEKKDKEYTRKLNAPNYT